MNMTDVISVIVPIYKVESYLDRCIQSIVGQTYPNLEIILVDDGSPDRCPAMCDDWAKKDSRIMVIHKENGGLSDARNAGMRAAKGEYLAFVDSDDYIAPDMLESLLRAIEQDRSDIAACTVEMVWEDETPSRLLTVNKRCVLDRNKAQAALLNETLLKQPVWYKLYKRTLICEIPFEVGKYHEDVFWSYQAVGCASRVSLVDKIGYYYTQRTGSIMGAGYSLKRLDAMEAYEKRYQYVSREFPELEQKARVKILLSCIYNGQMALRYLENGEKALAFDRLEKIKRRYLIKRKDYAKMPVKRRLWLDLARFSLTLTCRIRNALNIGQ